MLKYMTRWGMFPSTQIPNVEVERETADSVWVKGRRYKKLTTYECYWDTWEAAHAFLVRSAERNYAEATGRCKRAAGLLEEIMNQTPPK